MFDLEPDHTPEEPKLRRIKEPHLVHEAYDRALRDEGIVEMSSQLLGTWAVRTHGSKLNMKSGEFGSPVEWHQDWAFYPHTNDDVLAVGLAIDDMTRDNGCLLAIPGSHRGPILDHNQDGAFVGAVTEHGFDPEDAEAIEVPAGGISIHHVRTLARVAAQRLAGVTPPAAADVLRGRRLPDLDRGRADELGPVPRHLRARRGIERGAHDLDAGAPAAAAADPLRLDLRDAARAEGVDLQVEGSAGRRFRPSGRRFRPSGSGRQAGMATPACSADCAAAKRAIGTRNGEQDT